MRGEHRGVPPVSTLLESADQSSPFPRPRHAVHFRRRADAATSIADDQRSLVDTGRRRESQARLDEEAQRIQAEIVPGDWEDWSPEDREAWLEENNIPRYLYPGHEGARMSGFASMRQTPESMLHSDRPHSRNGPHRPSLPTPPHDESADGDSLFVPTTSYVDNLRRANAVRRQHPLSRSWRPDSPVNGLGDRNRSPTPTDHWEVMRQTIAPDTTLPSADSSFTSAIASQSFNSNNSTSTAMTELDYLNSSDNSRRNSQDEDDSVSSVDPDDLICDDDEMAATAAFAELVFREEQLTSEGRLRIQGHSTTLDREGNRYALHNEQRTVELGFRLIDEAVNTPEGRMRIFQLAERLPSGARYSLMDWILGGRHSPYETADQRRTRLEHVRNDELPPLRSRYDNSNTELANDELPPLRSRYDNSDTREDVRRQVHGFFRRFTADETLSASQRETMRMAERTSPPPQYRPLPNPFSPDDEIEISQDEPIAHPVASLPGSRYPSRPASPPNARSERDVADALLSGDEQDLSAIRRVVERLAQRDDVPEEWWMSMGLNLSRTRARSRSATPTAHTERDTLVDVSRRVRSGRVSRGREAGHASRL